MGGEPPAGPGLAANLALNERVAELRRAGRPLVHMGLGEVGLPVPPGFERHLVSGAASGGYGPVAGEDGAREAVAGYFGRRGLPTSPEQVVLGPGSKPLLAALIAGIPGDLLLPRPCWLSYPRQGGLFGRRVCQVPVPPEGGGVPDPDALATAIRAERRDGADPGILILTTPDNPTGALASSDELAAVCAVARSERVVVVADEIYRDTVHDPAARFVSAAELLPESTVVTTGLSKHMALGGWRVGAARFPPGAAGNRLRARTLGVASELWSTVARPLQRAAEYGFGEPSEVEGYVRAATRLHARVASEVHAIVVASGARCPTPRGGFYVYPSFEPVRGALASRGVSDAPTLEEYLLEECGVAVLGGHHFGASPEELRVRMATSLLYGETEDEQWRALRSTDPVALPHITDRLARLRAAMDALVDDPGCRAGLPPEAGRGRRSELRP